MSSNETRLRARTSPGTSAERGVEVMGGVEACCISVKEVTWMSLVSSTTASMFICAARYKEQKGEQEGRTPLCERRDERVGERRLDANGLPYRFHDVAHGRLPSVGDIEQRRPLRRRPRSQCLDLLVVERGLARSREEAAVRRTTWR